MGIDGSFKIDFFASNAHVTGPMGEILKQAALERAATSTVSAPQLKKYTTQAGEGTYIPTEQLDGAIFDAPINRLVDLSPRLTENPDAMKCWYDLTTAIDATSLPYSKLLADSNLYAEWTTSNPLLAKQGLAWFDGVLHQMYCVKPAVFDLLMAAAGQSEFASTLAKVLGL